MDFSNFVVIKVKKLDDWEGFKYVTYGERTQSTSKTTNT